jgi:hypothetical protein
MAHPLEFKKSVTQYKSVTSLECDTVDHVDDMSRWHVQIRDARMCFNVCRQTDVYAPYCENDGHKYHKNNNIGYCRDHLFSI